MSMCWNQLTYYIQCNNIVIKLVNTNTTMDKEDGQFYVDPEEQEIRQIIQIEEANPICLRDVSEEPPRVSLKMVELPKPQSFSAYIPFRLNVKQQSEESEPDDTFAFYSPFTEFYSMQQLVYQRFNNSELNKINSVVYFSGAFIQRQIISNSSKKQIQSLPDILKESFEINDQDLPQLSIKSKTQLIFDSNFESGNLFAVFKISEKQYDLVMQNDTNSCGNNQWFYFSVRNMSVGVEYTFNVVNFTKNDSLFNYGMKPVACSERNNIGWHKIGHQVIYKKGKIPKQNSRRFYYKLSFRMNWKYPNDTVYIAHSYPYTYSHLIEKLRSITLRNKDTVTGITIGKSLSHKNIQSLVITKKTTKMKDTRKAIIVMARQHPGETQGSFVCEGFINFLLQPSKEAEFIRKNYIVYVIPMINPDGVIFGHYRTNLAGKDLNRKWDSTDKKEQNCPQVTCIKTFISDINKEREIRFIIDFHGHSKKLNSFFYGNPCPEHPELVRIFPYICSKLSPAVQFHDCTFASEQYKRKAARVYLSYLFKQVQVYTFQASFYGYFKEGKKEEFTPNSYEKLGEVLLVALGTVLEQQDFKSEKTKEALYGKCLQELKSNQSLLNVGMKNQSGSESKPQDGELADVPFITLKQKSVITPVKESDRKTEKRSESRKGGRQLKQYKQITKPVRNLRFLEMSRVNPVLPDRYHLGLQPTTTTKKENLSLSRTFSSLKINSECQTDGTEIFQEYKSKQIQESQNLSNSVKIETRNIQKNYTSVIKNTTRQNTIIFRIDVANQRSNSINRQLKTKKSLFNAYSQTVISCRQTKRSERIRSSQLFPSVEAPDMDKKLIKTHQIKYESGKISVKRQAEIFLNGVTKKLLLEKDIKIRDNSLQYIERPLSIKRKELYKKF